MADSVVPPASDPPPSRTARGTRRGFWFRLALGLLAIGSITAWRYTLTRPNYRYRKANEAITQKDWDGVRWYAERLAAAGRDDLAMLALAEMELQRGEPLAAAERLARFPDTGDRAAAAVMVGRAMMGLHRPRDAGAAFRLALELRPDSIEARRGAAQLAYNIGQLDTAVAHLEQLLVLDAVDGKPAKLLGDIQSDLGRHDEAIAAYRESLVRELPVVVRREAERSLANSLGKRGRFDELLALWMDSNAAGASNDAEWSALRGEAYRGTGSPEDARRIVDSALKSFPPTSRLLALRGQLELDSGDVRAAVKSLEAAVALAPADYPMRLALSQAYAADGRKDDADRAARKAEELRLDLELITKLTGEAEQKPWDAPVRRQLADVCERMGNTAMARQWRELADQLSR
ncbi:MAG: tetratricopeptide repeat protein [Gemmataceae bacterium]|nr:tetratricopeptide repeat protein [Planctomycetia bacterium]MBX3397993.1 tetratricopeptide repeat protein [Gemmataceae bacterium]